MERTAHESRSDVDRLMSRYGRNGTRWLVVITGLTLSVILVYIGTNVWHICDCYTVVPVARVRLQFRRPVLGGRDRCRWQTLRRSWGNFQYGRQSERTDCAGADALDCRACRLVFGTVRERADCARGCGGLVFRRRHLRRSAHQENPRVTWFTKRREIIAEKDWSVRNG